MNSKLRSYAILFVFAIIIMGYFTYSNSIAFIKDKYDNLNNSKINYEDAKDKLEQTKKKFFANQKKIKEEIAARERERNMLKTVYSAKRTQGMNDDTALFAKMLQDTVKMIKHSGLKVSSIDFYSDITNQEPLLKGATVSIENELNLNSGDSQNNNSKSESVFVSDYKGYQVDFGFMGSYHSLNTFLKQLNDYKYLVKVKKLESIPYPKNNRILMSNVSLVFFVNTK